MSHTPFDMSRGVIPNENGRVNDSGKKHPVDHVISRKKIESE